MPAAPRRQPAAVVQRLLQAPHGFAFVQAMRLLERWVRRQEGLPSAQVMGQRIAVRNSLSLAFPASEIAEFKAEGELVAEDGVPQSRSLHKVSITPAFMGLLGAGGALPRYYTEQLAEREAFQRDGAARAFLDIFQHRAAVLFYQAWQKHRLPVQFESDRDQRYLPLVLALAGLGHAGMRDRLHADEGGVADDALAHFAGALQRRPVSAVVLRQLLQRYFNVPVRLEQFIGRWFTLPQGNRSLLGLQNMQLPGAGASGNLVLGERVYQRDLRVRLAFGPLDKTRFARFLPGGSAALALGELLRLFTGPLLEYEVRLTLRAEDVQGMALNDASSARLGWNTFLITAPATQDRSDLGYDLLAAA